MEKTTGMTLSNVKTNLNYIHGSEKARELTSIIREGIFGDEESCCPQVFF